MTTREMIPLIEAEIRTLGAEALRVPFGMILKAIQDQGTPEADTACRAFAATGLWPPLADPVRLEVLCRLCFAKWQAEKSPDDDWVEVWPTTLASALIECWHDGGRLEWAWTVLLNKGELPEQRVQPQDTPDWAG